MSRLNGLTGVSASIASRTVFMELTEAPASLACSKHANSSVPRERLMINSKKLLRNLPTAERRSAPAVPAADNGKLTSADISRVEIASPSLRSDFVIMRDQCLQLDQLAKSQIYH